MTQGFGVADQVSMVADGTGGALSRGATLEAAPPATTSTPSA